MILVTGGGFIGRAITSRFGSDALLLSRSKGADIVLDLCKVNAASELKIALGDKNVTHIIHTAAVTPWGGEPDYEQDIAMAKTLSIVCNELAISSLVYMSGWNVYDMASGKPPYDEETPTQPDTEYGASKLAVERYFKENLNTTTKLINIRLASVYGPGQTSAGLIPNLVKSGLENGKLTINSKDTRRDYLYIDDLVSAVRELIGGEFSSNININMGSGTSISVAECAELVGEVCSELSGSKVEIAVSDTPTESALVNNQLAIRKAQSLGLLGDATPFSVGLKEYVKWCMNQ